ncbi:glycosyltransferase family 2 protein [Anabaena azotica]|uniref:glycosyltransferase family 2 protein n=1 Tax=Anabaena azotica TaxID=197653 RepID=UPI0039A5C1FE
MKIDDKEQSPNKENSLVTIVIATKNRADCLHSLIDSIHQQDYKNIEIIIGDDGSDIAINIIEPDIKIFRSNISRGACFIRNRCLEISQGEFIIIFDDDTEIRDPSTITRAVTLAEAHSDVGAIAFHQIFADGTSQAFQPANVDYLSYIVTPAFYGCLLRREALLKLKTGLIEEFNYYYEEVELTLRLLDAGYKVIYDPELKVIHYADDRGRNWQRIRRLWARNAMLTAFLRYPWLAVFPALIATIITFLRMQDERRQHDWAGVFWIISNLTNLVPFALSNRCPIKNQTLKLFKQLRNQPMPVVPQKVNDFT